LVTRLAGLWLIWSSWASATGWILSALGVLNTSGYASSLPVLFGVSVLWWHHSKSTSAGAPPLFTGNTFRKRRILAICYGLLAVLSLASALRYIPWSYDAVSYRLPRCLYWLDQQRWHWIGTLDGRLDYSSCGLEWQTVPVFLLAKTDRLLFLLAYVPYLLLPGLVYLGGRTLGQSRRSLLVWMWVIPAAYSITLQCSGIQNDGYSTTYVAACLAFSGLAIRGRSFVATVFAMLAASLLTGAKLSNLPLLLPLGILLLISAFRSRFFRPWAVPALALAAVVSFLPLAVLSLRHSGTWTGDPQDQWNMRAVRPAGAVCANLVITANDLIKPPVLFGTSHVNRTFDRIEKSLSPAFAWMKKSHRQFDGINFGDMVYEGQSGPGFSIGFFLTGGLLAGAFIRNSRKPKARPAKWRWLVLGSGIFSWLVLLSQLASGHSPRNFTPYLPLLLFACAGIPWLHRFLHSSLARPVALVSMLSVVPLIILTPARPLIPLSMLAKLRSIPVLDKPLGSILDKYDLWASLRDDLKPMREHLPPGEKIIGFACNFRDTGYGLWKPFGSRTFREIGTPIGSPDSARHEIPAYVVANDAGISKRFGMTLADWSNKEGKEVKYSFTYSTRQSADETGANHEWYLLGPVSLAKDPPAARKPVP
jgi:hypothetical protein